MSPARKKVSGDGPGDQHASGSSAPGETVTCPWCSATVPLEAARCPSCNAALRDVADGEVLGVTSVDIAATTRLARMTKQPGRLATWLGAEKTTENPELVGRIEPPSEEVKREMLKLELAALDAEIEAKRQAAEANRRLESADTGESTSA
ncbi:MAG TPA: hypothetical protein VNL94_00665 [Candidatus Binatia bacterium]|nr:hypothetical protein [Candidatus Binatia bacterium]